LNFELPANLFFQAPSLARRQSFSSTHEKFELVAFIQLDSRSS